MFYLNLNKWFNYRCFGDVYVTSVSCSIYCTDGERMLELAATGPGRSAGPNRNVPKRDTGVLPKLQEGVSHLQDDHRWRSITGVPSQWSPDVIITLSLRQTTFRRRFDVRMTLLLRRVSVRMGWRYQHDCLLSMENHRRWYQVIWGVFC